MVTTSAAMTIRRARACALSTALLLAVMVPFATRFHAAAQRGGPAHQAPATPAKKRDLKGVPNFGELTPTLSRGGQPTAEGFQELRKLGVEIVVNFRNKAGEIETERRQVEALGLRYVSTPWSILHNPTSQQVAGFLELLQANPEKKIFVHCHDGADRTGVMVATFRIALENWAASQAVAEMNAFHYHHFWLPHLRKYVQDFPKLFAADPSFRPLRSAAHASAP